MAARVSPEDAPIGGANVQVSAVSRMKPYLTSPAHRVHRCTSTNTPPRDGLLLP